MSFSYAEYLQVLGLYFWPFVRISAMLALVPLYSGVYITVKARIMLAMLITLAVAPTLQMPEPISPFTWHGILVMMQQVGIGLAIGLIFAVVFEAFVIAGHLASMAMGLAMASMVDPSTGVNTPVIGRYYTILVSLLFLLMNGHIFVFKAVLDSFEYLPVGLHFLTPDSVKSVYGFGSVMFEAGVMIALPIVVALLIVNISLGVISRAAPSLNVFAIGFAITILTGFIMIIIVTPLILPNLQTLLTAAFEVIEHFQLND
ncbi:flagellar biosynthetic protein FliR [Thiosulfativibrio zosterae]|uniref:Flagellar biosynthetic protein FliR n=1 Tax=Thiosulfativibrio zosterae TaxID=2675053 RepID=A0A6F8PM74_9GAMM|nr:flagellar biosynthetic protein FliR [Thiosulfativibrio zosterae]BBP43147.1 flagellar biosynthetic protein FliR [Thiosulfativibrio zosterae]